MGNKSPVISSLHNGIKRLLTIISTSLSDNSPRFDNCLSLTPYATPNKSTSLDFSPKRFSANLQKPFASFSVVVPLPDRQIIKGFVIFNFSI